MSKLINTWNTIAIILLSSCLFSCKDNDSPKPASSNSSLATTTVKNLPADPDSKNQYTFFSFKNNSIIDRTDSATVNWDIGFKTTTIIVNGGTSGPGIGAALVYTGIFSDLTSAPSSGYTTDNSAIVPPNAIPTGSGNGWYNYNSTDHVISAIPGRVLVFRTAQGKYAKVEIISYYKDAPINPTSADIARYYTFRYMYQDDGSKNFQ